jgi:hypothetical protein
MAEITVTTECPSRAVATTREATALSRSTSATELPPYFWTMMLKVPLLPLPPTRP